MQATRPPSGCPTSSRLEERVDPERKLAPDERARRAKLLLRSQMAALALKAGRPRAAKRNPAPSDVRAGFDAEGTTDVARAS